MQSIATTKKYYFIGTAAILFILVYKISDDIGELKIIFNSKPFSFNVPFLIPVGTFAYTCVDSKPIC